MKLRLNFLNHLRALSFSLIIVPIIFVGGLLLGLEDKFLWIPFAAYSLFLIPSIYLHIEYYLVNRRQTIEIRESEIIVSDDRNNSKKFEFASLEKIILFKSASIDKGGVQMTPVESYHFAVIKTKNGESFFITNLLAPDVEKAIKIIKWVPYERRKLLFATLSEAK